MKFFINDLTVGGHLKANRALLIILFLLTVYNLESFSQNKNMYLKVKEENIRDNPNGKLIGKILSGIELKILDDKSNWIKVQFTGWIWKKSLTSDYTETFGFTVRASHILCNSKEDALKFLEKIENGASFEDIARENSLDQASAAVGGDIGEFGKGDLNPSFENAVFNLKVGEISEIIKTDIGYHIIKRTK